MESKEDYIKDLRNISGNHDDTDSTVTIDVIMSSVSNTTKKFRVHTTKNKKAEHSYVIDCRKLEDDTLKHYIPTVSQATIETPTTTIDNIIIKNNEVDGDENNFVVTIGNRINQTLNKGDTFLYDGLITSLGSIMVGLATDFDLTLIDYNFDETITVAGTVSERASIGGDPVINPFFGSGYKVKLPDLPGHVYRLLQGGGVTINCEIMDCPKDKVMFLQTRPTLFSDQNIIEGTYIGKIFIDVNKISFRHTIDLSQGIVCVECVLPDGACWNGDVTDGEIKHGVDPDYKGKYKQRIMSVGGGVMKFVVRIYEHPQVQNEFQVLRCNIDPSIHDGLLMRNYKPKLFFLNDLCDTRILSKHNKNSNPLTFRHPVVKNQVMMKCG
jgi:hypothetical protein